jgi:hypothetical protein
VQPDLDRKAGRRIQRDPAAGAQHAAVAGGGDEALDRQGVAAPGDAALDASEPDTLQRVRERAAGESRHALDSRHPNRAAEIRCPG